MLKLLALLIGFFALSACGTAPDDTDESASDDTCPCADCTCVDCACDGDCTDCTDCCDDHTDGDCCDDGGCPVPTIHAI